MTGKPATIQDVARRAQVSTATVSRTLSAPESVSQDKRAAVLEAIRSTGYRVNRAARSLRTQRSHTVLALLPSLANPFFAQVLKGMENVLTPTGQALMIAETQQIQAAGDDLIDYLEDRRADGIIVLDGNLPEAFVDSLSGSPHRDRVIFACEWWRGGGFPSVRSANVDGAWQATRFLHGLGHRRIAHVTGPQDNVLTHERTRGYRDFCRDHNLAQMLIPGDFSLAAGAAAARTLNQMSQRPTAVFCASDMIAFGLISTLAKGGVQVPRDMSVIGFDDIELCDHFIPALSSIRQDRIALGARSAQWLLRRMAGGSAGSDGKVESIPVTLIERDSTAPHKDVERHAS